MSDFVPYKQSLILYEELGFNESCYAVYSEYDQTRVYDKDSIREGKIIPAPLYQQAFRWFREKYNLHNGIYPYYDEYEFQIKDFRLNTNTPINGGLMKYEEAELACLVKLIEIVKEKKK